MQRILIRSGKDPFTVLSYEASLERYPPGIFGANVGNFLFGHSVTRALSVPGAEVVSNSMLTERRGVSAADIDRINNEFDVFVVRSPTPFAARLKHP